MLRVLILIGIIIVGAAYPVSVTAQSSVPVFAKYDAPSNPKDGRVLSHKKFKAAPYAVGDVSRFMFDQWTGPAIPVWTYVPTGTDLRKAPILVMMHGAKRNPARYLLEWAPLAEENGFIVIAPEFSKEDFKGSRRYNQGYTFLKKDGKYTPIAEEKWSFSAIEPLFDHTLNALDSDQAGYTLYGHSAGSQFVHRFLYYKPDARVKRYLAANAGWYTMPDLTIDYPYGLNNGHVPQQNLTSALGKNVLVLLGDQDINMSSGSLRKTPEAMQQGTHRYNRGVNFMKSAKAQAETLGVKFGWRAKRVKGVGHSNSGMAKAAAPFVK